MKVSTVVAQFPVELDIHKNLQHIERIIEQCSAHDLVVLPESSLSGYSDDLSFLDQLKMEELQDAIERLHVRVMEKHVHLFVGACLLEDGSWFNAGIYLSPKDEHFIYRKVNLATHEREKMTPGDALPVINLNINGEELKVGIQLCREIRYPEQWQVLANQGADLIIYMTHAIEDSIHRPVWRSHLISHAASTQRFVLAANTAHAEQLCPSMMINPKGIVLQEEISDKVALLRQVIDTSQVSNWYLNQARTDVVSVDYKMKTK